MPSTGFCFGSGSIRLAFDPVIVVPSSHQTRALSVDLDRGPANIHQCPGATEAWTGRPGLRGPFGEYGFVRIPREIIYVHQTAARSAAVWCIRKLGGNAQIRRHQRGPVAPAGLSRPLWPQGIGVYIFVGPLLEVRLVLQRHPDRGVPGLCFYPTHHPTAIAARRRV